MDWIYGTSLARSFTAGNICRQIKNGVLKSLSYGLSRFKGLKFVYRPKPSRKRPG